MKSIIFLIASILVFSACRNRSPNAIVVDPEGETALHQNAVKNLPMTEGLRELQAFEGKYENRWASRPEIFPHSNGETIKVFKLDCEGQCFKSEFKKRVSEGREIARKDLDELVDILKDPKSYGQGTAACYDPKFGLVVYDAEGVPVEFLSICLDCNNFRTYPGKIAVDYEDEMRYGFSDATRYKLRDLFLRWGIDYLDYQPLWDDEQEFAEYLDSRH